MLISPLKICPLAQRSSGGGVNETLCSYYFDRVNNYIDMMRGLDATMTGSNKVWSFRTVFRRTTTANGMSLLSKWLTTGNQRAVAILILNTGNVKVFFSDDGNPTTGDWTSTGTLLDTNWHHLIIRYNNGVVTVRLDGADYAGTSTTIPTTVFNSTQSFLIGAQNSGTTGFFEGYINQMQVTSDIITDGEDVTLYNAGQPIKPNGVIDNMELNTLFDSDPWDGSNFTVINTAGTNGVTSGMIAVDKDCNENPY